MTMRRYALRAEARSTWLRALVRSNGEEREGDRAQDDRQDPAPPGDGGEHEVPAPLRVRGRCRRASSLPMTWTSIGPGGGADGPVDDRPAHQVRPPAAPAGPDHELGGVLGPGHRHQCLGHVGADHLDIAAAELLEQRPVAGHPVRRRRRHARCRAARGRPTSSAFARVAMRAARRTRSSPPGAPVSETTTRSLVSHGPSIPWRSR